MIKIVSVKLENQMKNLFINTSEISKSMMKKNAFAKHNLETKHSFNFEDSKKLVYIYEKQPRKIFEISIIFNYNIIKDPLF